MMMKEVLVLALLVWMVMPAHPWKQPEHGYGNDDTSDKLERPSPQNTQKNIRARRNYLPHGYGYSNPTGPEIFRQLRQPKKSAWDTCKELFTFKELYELAIKTTKSENSNKASSSNVLPKPLTKVTKRYLRAFGNYTYHGQSYLDPAGHGISRRKFRNRAAKGNSHTEVLPDVISFDYFKSKFNKKYGNESIEKERKTIFQNNMKDIEDHNKLFYSGKSSYKKGISEFSDMTSDDALNKLACGKEPIFPDDIHSRFREERQTGPEYVGKKHEDVDYRKCEATNAIRNQGYSCSCWAFSVTSSIESQIFIKSKTLPILSEQYLIDCCKEYYERHKSGCLKCHEPESMKGGGIHKTITCVKLKGIALGGEHYRNEYSGQPQTCREIARKTPYKVYDMKRIKQNDEDELKKALVRWGPISIAMFVPNNTNFFVHTVGVLDDKLCGPNGEVNHAVVLVGYGTEKGKDYWLIRNSYGDTVGDEGYFKLTRDGNSNCNDTTYGYIPMVELGIQQ